MLLSRVITHVKAQHWTAITIDFVIVVLGVFIGIQVSNWNQQRQTDQKAVVFTRHLKDDLRAEAWNLEVQIGYNQQVLVNAQRAADALDGRRPLSDEALLIAAYRATQYNSNQHRRATYDELTSTGEIGLIHSPGLRTLAMDVYNLQQLEEIEQHGRDSEFRREFRAAFPYQVQLTLADHCGDRGLLLGDYAGIATVLDYPCRSGLDAATIATSATILRRDPRFLAALQLRIADLGTDLSALTDYTASYIREPLQRLLKETP